MKSFLMIAFGVILLVSCQRSGTEGGGGTDTDDQGDTGQQQGQPSDQAPAKVIVKAGAVQAELAGGECVALKAAELPVVSVKPQDKEDVLCSQRVAQDACFATLPTAAGSFEWNAAEEKLVATQKTGCKSLGTAATDTKPAAEQAAPEASSGTPAAPPEAAPASSGG